MKFGKRPDISTVDFTLPVDASQNKALFDRLPKTPERPNLYVGCTGWSMKEWDGKVYPKATKAKDYLKYYSEQFNTIELNTTHYRIPNTAIIAKWYQESSADFHFCPKIPQVISHRKDLGYGSGKILAFCEAAQELKEKLGHSFMQLPPYFGPDRLPVLKHFLENFPSHIPLSIEFRQENWFNTPGSFDEVATLLEKHNIATVITDVAGRRDVLHQRLTSDTVVIRFVGNNLAPSDYQRIDAWIQRMKIWFEKGIRRIYFFTHEPDNLLAPELADYVVKESLKHLEVITRGPDLEKYVGGDQMSLF
ncbi:MAG: hypothetical protein ACI8P3_002323 [Saprospiraceae bacterium]|jgi:uncharacterized protein YecE (DUF72 family)